MNGSYDADLQDEIDAESGAGARVGLWSDPLYRRLTIFNASVVGASAVVGLAGLLFGPSELIWTMAFVVPVVPATVMMPLVSLAIVLAAAALSSLNMIGEKQKGVRFFRAMTVWGTGVLATQMVIALLWVLLAVIASVL